MHHISHNKLKLLILLGKNLLTDILQLLPDGSTASFYGGIHILNPFLSHIIMGLFLVKS